MAEDPSAIDDRDIERYSHEYRELKAKEKPFRRDTVARAARGELSADAVIGRNDAVRTLRRLGYHVWRTIHHLSSHRPREAARSSPGDMQTTINQQH